MRGVPQSGFSWDIRRISRVSSRLTHGRPLDFHLHKYGNPWRYEDGHRGLPLGKLADRSG